MSLATYNVRDVKAFFEKNKWLYVAEDDLESIRDRLRTEINKRKNPLFVSLGDDEPIDSMQKRIGKRNALDERFPGGLFTSSQRRVHVDRGAAAGRPVRRARGRVAVQGGAALIARDPARRRTTRRCAPRSRGPIATAIASRQAVENDIMTVTVTCLLLVALSIGLYFRQLRAIPLTGVPAVIGAVVAFGVAELAFGYLNVVDGVPGVDHPRQRHQLRDRPDVALRGAARARRRPVARRCARRCTAAGAARWWRRSRRRRRTRR